MLALEEIQRRLANRTLVTSNDPLPRGHVRLETGLLYPDGSSVDVFVVNDVPLHHGPGPIRLSDLGQTTAWLLDLQVRVWLSKKRQAFVEDVLRLYRVRRDGGALILDLGVGDDLAVAVLRLAQACLRVADLMFTRRASLQSASTDEIEEVLADSDLPFDANVELSGRHGEKVRVDYVAQGKARRSAVMGLSALNAQSAHTHRTRFFVAGMISSLQRGTTTTSRFTMTVSPCTETRV